MKNLIKFIIIFSIFSSPVQAACDFLIDIGDSGKKIFDKFGQPLPGFKGQFYMPVPSPELCPNDNLNDDIAVEYVFYLFFQIVVLQKIYHLVLEYRMFQLMY